jgi:imidazolonepropionase-like amidohydrolase
MRQLAIVPDGAMLIRDGRIQAIGSRAGMERVVSADAEIVDGGGQIGSLEPGKFADFAIHDCGDHRELSYFFGREPAWAVHVGGTCVNNPPCF